MDCISRTVQKTIKSGKPLDMTGTTFYFFSPFLLTLFPECLAPIFDLEMSQKLKITIEWHYERLSIGLISILHNFQGNLPTVHSGKTSIRHFQFLNSESNFVNYFNCNMYFQVDAPMVPCSIFLVSTLLHVSVYAIH